MRVCESANNDLETIYCHIQGNIYALMEDYINVSRIEHVIITKC